MSNKKIIGLFGVGQTDICIYLASILQNLKYSVLCIDNSFEQAMHFCVPQPKERISTITHKKVDYEWLVDVNDWSQKDYDFIIVDLGVWPKEDQLLACDEIYLVIDCAIAQVERYRELMKHMKLPMNVIVRDICTDVVSGNQILDMLKEENCFVVDEYKLPFSEDDLSGRLAMQYFGYRGCGHLSPALDKMLVCMIRNLAGCENSCAWKSYRRAKKGVCA